VTSGNLVEAGPPATLLTTVVSLDPMYVYFDSDEQTYLRYAGRARHGSNWRTAKLPVYLGLANEDGFPHEGQLDFVDNQIDPNTGTIRTRAVFSNASRALTPGLFAGSSWWATTSERRCWCAMPRSGPIRTASLCWWLAREIRWLIARSFPAGWWTGFESSTRACSQGSMWW
jgi:hypothetical protein